MRIDPDECRNPDLLAAEVRRLQAVIAAGEPTLTDEERDAVGYFAMFYASPREADAKHGKTLRSLLERLT
ncbi:MAG: hypothetical protein EBR82_46200 [Caulobacteraceae bacterium]|nr:hypothetical protein [Caulobacteraceae bacterium]